MRPCILIADDNENLVKLLARLLAETHDVITVSSGAQALVLLAAEQFDVVLTDVRMQGADGFEVLRTVKERSNGWRVKGNHRAAGSVRFVDVLTMNTRRLRGLNRLAVGLFLGTALLLLAGTPPELASRFRDREAVSVTELQRGPRGAHRVAVTFDAGGEADAFPALLAALAAARVRSTFFLTGEWMRQHPDLVRLLVSSGHEIGNHTWSHRDLTRLGDAQIRTEFQETAALLAQHVPRPGRRWWRAPFGARDSRVLRIASELGYVSVYWTLDSLDSVAPQKSRAFLVERIAHRSDAQLDGAIILMHVGEPATAKALPEILSGLQRRGFELATISRLLSSTAITEH